MNVHGSYRLTCNYMFNNYFLIITFDILNYWESFITLSKSLFIYFDIHFYNKELLRPFMGKFFSCIPTSLKTIKLNTIVNSFRRIKKWISFINCKPHLYLLCFALFNRTTRFSTYLKAIFLLIGTLFFSTTLPS